MKSKKEILKTVSKMFDISIADILSRNKSATVFKARREAARRMREGGMSYPEIGMVLGRSHSTVMNMLKK